MKPIIYQAKVIPGQGQGKKIGWPTINLQVKKALLPAPGVYLVKIYFPSSHNYGLAAYGYSVLKRQEIIEIYSLDPIINQVIKQLKIVFLTKLRPLIRFKSFSILKRQISQDVFLAERLLNKKIMFSGIVSDLGLIESIKSCPRGKLLVVKTKKFLSLIPGDSLAVNGCCLTVINKSAAKLFFQLMPETVKATNLNSLIKGSQINLEAPLKLGDLISGHFVTGHIDCVCQSQLVQAVKGKIIIKVFYHQKYKPLLIAKGSIAVNGVSLTIVKVTKKYFTVELIDYTMKQTNLSLASRQLVNVEFDILAKYAQRQLFEQNSVVKKS